MGEGGWEGQRERFPGETLPHPGRKWSDGQWEGSARLRHSRGARHRENFKEEDTVCLQPLRPGLKGPGAEAAGWAAAWGQSPA